VDEPALAEGARAFQLDQPTRASRLKWVIVVDESLSAGIAANAAVCLAAAVGQTVPGVCGPAGKDATGNAHPGLPWAGCAILAGPAERLARIRGQAPTRRDVCCVDMPTIAQTNRVYAGWSDRPGPATPGRGQQPARWG
jgi:hypothetical protein